MLLTDYTSRSDTLAHFSREALWQLFDGEPDRLNIAHECVDRHRDSGRIAIHIAHANGGIEAISFDTLSRDSARFAHRLHEAGIGRGDRIAVMLDPFPAFYTILFGALKAGAAIVPLFTLFGGDAIMARMTDSEARLLITTREKAAQIDLPAEVKLWVVDGDFTAALAGYPETFNPQTSADDVAFYQYTSGTTRQMPAAVPMTHRSIVLTMLPGLYGVGLRPGDRAFCPSSPAWGHGLWQGTLAPLALGITVGSYAGKFDPERLLAALAQLRITNLTAAATHYRMIRLSDALDRFDIPLTKLSFAGEPMDGQTEAFLHDAYGLRVCSIYGSTEVGAVMGHYPEAADVPDRPGSLGLPLPGMKIEVQRDDGSRAEPGEIGEIKVWRRGAWMATRDLGRQDADGFFYHSGRADDVIISAGWTLSAVEIEHVLLRHPDVLDAAAVGVPDATRGQVVKAFVVSQRAPDEKFAREVRDFVRDALGKHEYPREVSFVAELPKTPSGKTDRKTLRKAERPLGTC